MDVLSLAGNVLLLITTITGWVKVYQQKKTWAMELTLAKHEGEEQLRGEYREIERKYAQIKKDLRDAIATQVGTVAAYNALLKQLHAGADTSKLGPLPNSP